MTDQVRVLNRLSATAYAALEKATLGILPRVPATGEAALVQSGVELVLRALRNGYVIEE